MSAKKNIKALLILSEDCWNGDTSDGYSNAKVIEQARTKKIKDKSLFKPICAYYEEAKIDSQGNEPIAFAYKTRQIEGFELGIYVVRCQDAISLEWTDFTFPDPDSVPSGKLPPFAYCRFLNRPIRDVKKIEDISSIPENHFIQFIPSKVIVFETKPNNEEIIKHLEKFKFESYQLKDKWTHKEIRHRLNEIRYMSSLDLLQGTLNLQEQLRGINSNYTIELNRGAELENYNLINWHRHGYKDLARVKTKRVDT